MKERGPTGLLLFSDSYFPFKELKKPSFWDKWGEANKDV